MTTKATNDYPRLAAAFRRVLSRSVPRHETVLVVSRGDAGLLDVPERTAWHFPRRDDGTYAGHHPADNAAAIGHLAELVQCGARFIAIPATSAWWLDHYAEFAAHLRAGGRLLVDDPDVGCVFSLFEPGDHREARPVSTASSVTPSPLASLAAGVGSQVLEQARTLVDIGFYGQQAQTGFASVDEALEHYMTVGHMKGLSPHPLFSPSWYLNQQPEADVAGMNPLLHFLTRPLGHEMPSPSPFFDAEYYVSQSGNRSAAMNPLVHYVRAARDNKSFHPNPLFRDGFYLKSYTDATERPGETPLEHFLRVGCGAGRFASPAHRDMWRDLAVSAHGRLRRGKWRRGKVLIFNEGSHPTDSLELAARLAEDHHLDPLLVRLGGTLPDVPSPARQLLLADYGLAGDINRPAALRLLIRALTSMRPLFAFTDGAEAGLGLALSGVPTYLLIDEPDGGRPRPEALRQAVAQADRVVVSSSRSFHELARVIGSYPVNVFRDPRGLPLSEDRLDGVGQLLERALHDFAIATPAPPIDAADATTCRRIIIPCTDWAVSGVNAALEAVGLELARLGWQVEILFTRSEGHVMRSAGDPVRLPTLPYRFLVREGEGLQGLWEALLADVETSAPCILFTSYDFLGNSVVPALTENVGVVMWVQADDQDYYEQAYRLGRYCNAVVGVSRRIKSRIEELNPIIGSRTHVVHNASVRQAEVARRHAGAPDHLRLVYTGRLVEYQKRVFDYVLLAGELDRLGVPYTLTMIGEFSNHRSARERFEALAAEHLADGRIVLAGRLDRSEILKQLDGHDVFVLLSDFEGMPLALLEAMARGCVPVVADMESGIPELITDGDNGMIMVARDYEKWAHEIAELWRDRDRFNQMSKNARSTIRRRFTVERAGRRFDALFSSVAEALIARTYNRPASLHWGEHWTRTGDVLPPPFLAWPAATKVEEF